MYKKIIKIALLLLTYSVIAQDNLPNLGNNMNSILPPNEEKVIGDAMLHYLRREQKIHVDAISTEYLIHLGQRLSSKSKIHHIPTNFFLLADPSPNAFAFFGSNISIHDSMILSTQSESELAAVMAHELAHIKQRHLLRGLIKQKQMTPALIAGVAASIAIGVPELITATLSGYMQKIINFTREHEKEADRIGIQILYKAGFNPHGMPNVFGRMSKGSRLDSRPPQYLMTHPMFESRVAETRALANRYGYKQDSSSLSYMLIKKRLQTYKTVSKKKKIKELENQIKDKRYANQDVTLYAIACYKMAINDNKGAHEILERLRITHPHELVIDYTYAENLKEISPEMALNELKILAKRYPESPAIILLLADVAVLQKQWKIAKEALLTHHPMNKNNEWHYILERQVYGALGDRLKVYTANAEWFYLHGDLPSAIEEQKTALKYANDKQKPNLEKRLTQLEEYYLILKSST